MNYSPPSTVLPDSSPLFTQRIAGTAINAPELVLLPGWSLDSAVWHPLVSDLREWFNVTLVDLPGTGRSAAGDWSADKIADALLAVAPQKAIYLGWSLGGTIALYLAHHFPERVHSVCAAATNPSFVATDTWMNGMPVADFKGFADRVERQGARALSRFDWLQSGGDKVWQGRLEQYRETASQPQQLSQSLALLAEMDMSQCLSKLAVPTRFILGSEDQLVPVEVAEQLTAELGDDCVHTVAQANHLLPWQHGDVIVEKVRELSAELRVQVVSDSRSRDKSDVARSFGKAAASYDSVADLQPRVGQTLLNNLPAALPEDTPGELLDLGCGTGFFRHRLTENYPAANYLGLDLAEGMINYARAQTGEGQWLVGDAEDLPLVSQSQDLIFSSLALQWCESQSKLGAELHRVLRPGGRCAIATLGPATLNELRAAWSAVDGFQHVNEFIAADEFIQSLCASGLKLSGATEEEVTLEYDDVLELLRELKGIGAHNVNAKRPTGMTGRAHFQQLREAYEPFRRDGKLPATYQVHYIYLERPQ